MDSKVRVARPLPNFWFQGEIESLLHGRISPFPSGWTQNYERWRAWENFLSFGLGPVGMKGREELREFSFVWCVNPWTQEKDSRELPSTFLETKERKVRCKISDLHWSMGNGGKRVSWVFFLWESQRRDKGATNKNKEGIKQRSKARMTKGNFWCSQEVQQNILGDSRVLLGKKG